VILASLANLSAGKVLIGGTVPGLVIALLYGIYIIGICWIRPKLAPRGVAGQVYFSARDRLISLGKALPLTVIIFLVTVVIFLGVATPTEAAALGALGAFFLAIVYRRFSWGMTWKAAVSTTKTMGMVFLIIAGANTFSQVMALTGAGKGLALTVTSLPIPSLGIVAGMLGIILILGCFIDSISIMMLTVPLYFPIIVTLGFDPIWFSILMLIGVELAGITPPVGLILFTLKGVYPEAKMSDIYRAAVPFVVIQLAVIAAILFFPPLATWFPEVMK